MEEERDKKCGSSRLHQTNDSVQEKSKLHDSLSSNHASNDSVEQMSRRGHRIHRYKSLSVGWTAWLARSRLYYPE